MTSSVSGGNLSLHELWQRSINFKRMAETATDQEEKNQLERLAQYYDQEYRTQTHIAFIQRQNKPQSTAQNKTTLIDLIIRDVAEIERDPLLGQHPDEMRVTADELRNILEARFEEVDRVEREQMDHEQYQSTVSA